MSLSLQDMTADGVSKANPTSKRHSRRRNRATEKELEHIISQFEDDIYANETREISVPVTPTMLNSNGMLNMEVSAPQTPSGRQSEALAHTPRRSTRKSVKPVQEYEDIVSRKRRLRSGGKVDNEERDEPEEEPQKWTPAKVGRVSQKRARKSRRGGKTKNLPSSSENEETEIANGEESEKKAQEENETTGLSEADLPKENELTVMTGIKIDTQNHETTLDQSNLTKTDHSNAPKEDEIILKFGDEVGPELETDIETQHVDNENALKNTDDIGRANVDTKVVQKENNGIEAASNAELNTTKENILKEDEAVKNGFGNYLKNNTLDMSDLGLNPINEDLAGSLEDKAANTGKLSPLNKEIPIVTLNDDIFNDSDCIIINTEEDKAMEEDMQPLRISDDETTSSPPRKSPRIVLTTQEGEQHLLNSSAPILQDATPKRYSKTVLRKPTPFKAPSKSLSEDDDEGIVNNEKSVSHDAVPITVSKMEPKEIVLRSIRKRSWSVCIGGAEAESRRKNVTFYSPANQTTILEDLDIRIVQSVNKSSRRKKGCPETFVTQRRKRSLSFDEGSMMKNLKSPGQPSSKMRTTPIAKPPRTKLPNFAAIHRKNFEKMENLVDHVNRKAERAKVLTNSATKIREASAQKSVPPTNTPVVEKPKAVKRINLHNNSVNTTFTEKTIKPFHTMATGVMHKVHNDSKLPIPQIAVLKPLPSTTESTLKENHTLKLPNPRLGIIKPQTITSFTSSNKNPTPAKIAGIKPIHTRQPLRPAFNLSTALESANVNHTATTITSTAAHPGSFDQKMASRRQRRMDMFKGRGAANSQRTTPGTAEKNYSHQIRGVRSNRRFELQMAHRKNMEH